ncbi:MAG: cobalamin B12-binding domain-containing protein [Chloroflexi bacterium]|nr:cobalamin B12-binding domain-containing protein [Chloroflexota bacterium]
MKVIIAKTSLDGHWRGVAVVSAALRDAGMEVIYAGVLPPEQLVEAAIQEDVDVVGLNIGGRYGVVERTLALLHEKSTSEVLVVAGGTVPDDDIPRLKELGIAGVFPPGSSTANIVEFINTHVATIKKEGAPQMTERLFSDEERTELGKRTVDLIQEAIDAGELEKAKGLSRRMYKEFLGMHDLYRDWIAATLSLIGRKYGDEALDEALAEGVAAWIMPLVEQYDKASLRRRVEMMAGGLRGHLQPMTIEEDDEKVTVMLNPCGSGARLLRDGFYEPPHSFLKVAKAQQMTYGREDFPVYCAHCAYQALVPRRFGANPPFILEPACKLGEEPCRFVMSKKDGAQTSPK